MILLWLFCARVIGQDSCSSPGDFPSPTLSLNSSSAQVGDSVLAQCSLRPNSLATLVIFCQDGKGIATQKALPGQALYGYVISVQSSGQFRCMYQYKNDQNQVKNSRLSLPQTLHIPDRSVNSTDTVHSNSSSSEEKSDLEGKPWTLVAIGGTAGLSVLMLAALIYLLVKKVAPRRKSQREQLPGSSTENTPTDEQIQYAAISNFGTRRVLQPKETEAATYAVIGKVRGNPS